MSDRPVPAAAPALDVPDYHAHVRGDVFHLIPGDCRRVLEIGMGSGGTMAALKKVRPVSFSAGIEMNEAGSITRNSKRWLMSRLFAGLLDRFPGPQYPTGVNRFRAPANDMAG